MADESRQVLQLSSIGLIKEYIDNKISGINLEAATDEEVYEIFKKSDETITIAVAKDSEVNEIFETPSQMESTNKI